VTADQAPRSSGSQAPRPCAANAIARILVVDDQPELAELLQVVLEGEGHVVTAVHSGEAALERLARQPYDLVICDLQMPDVDGVAVYRAATQGVPPWPAVLLMTGYADSTTYGDFLQTTAVAVLTKPVGLDALRSHAERLLAAR